MKKYLLTGGFAAALLLGACGDDEEEAQSEENTEEVAEEDEVTEESEEEVEGQDINDSEDVTTEDESEGETTDDLMEFATNPDMKFYEDNGAYTTYEKLGTYTTEEADENGTITNEHEGFEETLSILLVEDDMGDKHIAVVGEQINGTEEILYVDPGHDVTTDTMEQIESSGGTDGLGGMYEPETRHQGMTLATLEFPEDEPTEIDLELSGVFNTHDKEDRETPAYYADDFFIEYDTMTFTLMD